MIKNDKGDSTIDKFYISKAYNKIKKWFNNKDENYRESFKNIILEEDESQLNPVVRYIEHADKG